MVDTPGAQIDEYVSKLDSVLDKKMAVISGLRNKLQNFRSKLQEEETLNQSMCATPLLPSSIGSRRPPVYCFFQSICLAA